MTADPTDSVYRRADMTLRDRLSAMDVQGLLDEHRKHPYGPHSDELARLLNYFRRAGTEGKYVIYSRSDKEGWQIGRLNAKQGSPRIDLDSTVHPSSEAAQHAVLEARVAKLREMAGRE